MGVGGSGMSAVAQIAAAYGYEVSGCDLKTGGHDVSHLEGIDILAVTPAVFFQSAQHPELIEGRRRGILMTWQEFLGRYLHKNKFVVCIAGAHGKSTTTALTGLLLEAAGLDPTVEVGATVPAWHSNFRVGLGKYFVSEADEYYHNFLNYHPQIIILTMIEMDHPEYFGTFEKILDAYRQFVNQLQPGGVLIYNAADPGVTQLLQLLKPETYNLISYHLSDFPKSLKLRIPGLHNRLNAAAIIKLGKYLKINSKLITSTLTNFEGIGRRLEIIGQKHGITVIDDYANHPTSFAANLQAVKEKYPKSKIWAVIEPHTYSRLHTLLPLLPPSLQLADHIIVSRIFASRETDPGDFSGADIATAIGPKAKYIPEFTKIITSITAQAKLGDVILVMGSGDSYKLAKDLTAALN